MSDFDALIKSVKKAAVEAVEASTPANFMFGDVLSISPLQIRIDQKMTLGSAQLALCRQVTAYTDNNGLAIDNALKAGDKVVLGRIAGGQKFVVLDKVG